MVTVLYAWLNEDSIVIDLLKVVGDPLVELATGHFLSIDFDLGVGTLPIILFLLTHLQFAPQFCLFK